MSPNGPQGFYLLGRTDRGWTCEPLTNIHRKCTKGCVEKGVPVDLD